MNKRIARNVWLTNQYAKRYVKASGKLKHKLADVLEDLQQKQNKLVKELNKEG